MKLQNLLILFFLSVIGLSAGKPDWVKSRPVSSDYYIGIGIAQRGSGIASEDLSTVAKERALNDLISEISVKIQSVGISSADAINDSLQERYFEEIRLETEASLRGHEFVGEYKKGKLCYVYYRLKKTKWARIEKERLEKAISITQRHIANAVEFTAEGDALSVIDEYINAYNVLLPVLYLNPRGVVNGEEKILASFLKTKLREIARSLNYTYRSPVYNGVRKLYGSQGTRIGISLFNTPQQDMPLLIGGNLHRSAEAGIFLTADQIGQEDTVSLELRVAMDKLSPLCEQSVVVQNWVSSIQWPEGELTYIFRRPGLYVTTHELALDSDLDNTTLLPAMEELFSTKGYTLKNMMGSAEVVLSLKANTRSISAFSSLYFVYLDVVAEVLDKDGKKLFTKKFKPIKGGGLDYDQASIKAYEKAAPFVAKELLNWCEDNL